MLTAVTGKQGDGRIIHCDLSHASFVLLAMFFLLHYSVPLHCLLPIAVMKTHQTKLARTEGIINYLLYLEV